MDQEVSQQQGRNTRASAKQKQRTRQKGRNYKRKVKKSQLSTPENGWGEIQKCDF
jgi:hypothetical protein